MRVSPWFAHAWANRHRPRAPHQRSFKPADVYVRGAIHPLLVSLVLLRTGVRILHYDLRGAERSRCLADLAGGSCRMASPRTWPKATISSQLPSTPCAESSPRARMSIRARSRPWASPRPRPSRSGTRYKTILSRSRRAIPIAHNLLTQVRVVAG